MDETKLISDIDGVSQKKSMAGTSINGAHDRDGAATHRFSMLNTADEASGFNNSMMQDLEFGRRDFNEIDIVGNLDRDDKGNVVVPLDDKTGGKSSVDKDGKPINH